MTLPRRRIPAVACLLLACVSPALHAVESALVYPGTDGRLVYTTWAVRDSSSSVNKIPDFSFAGYKAGGVAIPLVPVKVTVSAVTGDDTANIQTAINQVSALTPDANGFRGAVLLNPGTYDCLESIVISTSGVVLRGSGNLASGGTRIRNTYVGTDRRAVIRMEGTDQTTRTNQTAITTAYVPVGAKQITVQDAGAYAVGDLIGVVRATNQTWINAMGAAGFTDPWEPLEYQVISERRVTAKSGNTLTIDVPLTHVIETQYGGGYVVKFSSPGRIQQVGVENLWVEFGDPAGGHGDDHAFYAVETIQVSNAWIRDVTWRYMVEGIRLGGGSKHVTVQDCASLDPRSSYTSARVYPYRIEYVGNGLVGGGYNLIQRCYSDEARHAFVPGPKIAGPDVILDCFSKRDWDHSGPHQRYAIGQLMDNFSSPRITVQNRGNGGTGHGWCGAQNVAWNCLSDEADKEDAGTDPDGVISIDSPTGAKNFEIGCRVINGSSFSGTTGFAESRGTHVATRSLYLKQLQDRLGSTAVNNITTAGQRTGTLWAALRSWAGNGNFTPGTYGGVEGNIAITDTYSAASSGWSNLASVHGDSTITGAATCTTDPSWVEYDFGADWTIKRARVNEDNAGSYQLDQWKVQYWTGSAWADAFAYTNSTVAGWNEVDFPDRVTSKIRLYLKRVTTSRSEIIAFECIAQ